MMSWSKGLATTGGKEERTEEHEQRHEEEEKRENEEADEEADERVRVAPNVGAGGSHLPGHVGLGRRRERNT